MDTWLAVAWMCAPAKNSHAATRTSHAGSALDTAASRRNRLRYTPGFDGIEYAVDPNQDSESRAVITIFHETNS